MPLPPELQAAIERELANVDRARLSQASEEVTRNYRRSRFAGALGSPESRAAYLLVRLPATFAANQYVFREVARLLPGLNPTSFLDLGAGPGTAAWAARELWPAAAHTLVENHHEWLELGRRLAEPLNANWIEADIGTATEFPASDVVVLSYSAGELKSPLPVVERAWQAAQKALIVLEPGTPRNVALVAEIRRQLIGLGAHPIAPCPHTKECPMAVAGDWCHFAVRVQRTAEHRRTKAGVLGYEDEKVSYLAFSKEPVPHAQSRIVRHPAIHGGHIQLTLCTPSGLQSPTVTRSDKSAFRAARKASWGDEWPYEG